MTAPSEPHAFVQHTADPRPSGSGGCWYVDPETERRCALPAAAHAPAPSEPLNVRMARAFNTGRIMYEVTMAMHWGWNWRDKLDFLEQAWADEAAAPAKFGGLDAAK